MSELDPALERLHLCGFEYGDGQPNYGPMAVSALAWLGHASLTTGLLDVYLARLPDLDEEHAIEPDAQRLRLGRIGHVADWIATFEARLAKAPWSEVFSEAVAARCEDAASPPLCPHAVVRVGYAIRNLEHEQSATRLRELAFGLAYLFARVEAKIDASAQGAWAERIEGASMDALAERLGEISLEGAERYIANPERRAAVAPGVTAPCALRTWLPPLSSQSAARALISLLIGLEAQLPRQLEVRRSDENEDLEVVGCAQDPSEVRYRAACSMHEHAIVTSESCLREEAFTTSAVLRRAAADAAVRLSPPGYREWR